MSTLRKFALAFGVFFVAVGLAGFIPGITQPHSHPGVMVTAGMGALLGLFPVNVLHNLVHLAFGGWGLLASRSESGAGTYARSVAVIYALFTVMGLVDAMGLSTAFGFVPLYGHDIWLHALLAGIAAYFGFMRPRQVELTHQP
ncbi:MAG: DUF4383 domain-containing protein [Burkholderiales bacterium]|nr:DUF4383 domain-containing protein [Burkholderiales bacterium]